MWGAKEERDKGGFQEVEVNCQKPLRGRCRIVRQEGGAKNTEREIENLPWTHQELRARRHALESSGGGRAGGRSRGQPGRGPSAALLRHSPNKITDYDKIKI